MEIGFFGFLVLVICYFLFRPAVKNAVDTVNEGVASLSLEFKEPEKVSEMKRKFGCTDPNVRSMSDLLTWVNSHKSS